MLKWQPLGDHHDLFISTFTAYSWGWWIPRRAAGHVYFFKSRQSTALPAELTDTTLIHPIPNPTSDEPSLALASQSTTQTQCAPKRPTYFSQAPQASRVGDRVNHTLRTVGSLGYIGGSVLARLLSHPLSDTFQTTALVRSESKAKQFRTLGIKAVVGSLSDLPLLRQLAAEADIVFACVSCARARSQVSSLTTYHSGRCG